MLVKILGGIDLISSFVFLMYAFGMHPPLQFVLFCAGLLFLKGLFIFKGDLLSAIDIVSGFVLLISLLMLPPMVFLWMPAFLLLAKGFVSFL